MYFRDVFSALQVGCAVQELYVSRQIREQSAAAGAAARPHLALELCAFVMLRLLLIRE